MVYSFALNAELTALFILFLLGMRHGFEPDHLAIIDGMTRCTTNHSTLAKWVGCLFSFGHGLIIVFITIFISLEAIHWKIPAWFNSLGTWISILSLFLLGIINLYITFTMQEKENIQFI